MVTVYRREEAIQESGPVDLAGFLTNPVTTSTLLDAIMIAMGKQQSPGSESYKRLDSSVDSIAKLAGARILLVEDNEINQQRAQDLLTSNGLFVEIANNGQEALDLLDKKTYDEVLMDCLMPAMDGYSASRRIREQEKLQNLPVIAMTDNAMASDREKVLVAGMDDHIAKPVNAAEMFNTMAKWIVPAIPTPGKTAPEVNRDETTCDLEIRDLPGIDTSAGLSIMQGNKALYFKLLKKFRASQSDFSTRFRTAQAENDHEAAVRCAHTLKGVAAGIGAKGVQSVAAKLEGAALSPGDAAATDSLLQEVAKELKPVLSGLEVLEELGTSPDNTRIFNPEELQEILGRLQELLEDDDTEAAEVIAKLQPQLAGSGRIGFMKQITEAIEQYDFDEALSLLTEFRKQLKTN